MKPGLCLERPILLTRKEKKLGGWRSAGTLSNPLHCWCEMLGFGAREQGIGQIKQEFFLAAKVGWLLKESSPSVPWGAWSCNSRLKVGHSESERSVLYVRARINQNCLCKLETYHRAKHRGLSSSGNNGDYNIVIMSSSPSSSSSYLVLP